MTFGLTIMGLLTPLSLKALSPEFSQKVAFQSLYFLPNPMMRTCNIAGGISIVVKVGEDQMLLCQIGQSLIGSLELFLFKTEKKNAEGIHFFLTNETDLKRCHSIQTVRDLDERSYELCFFTDGSILDKITFEKGLKHSDNQALKKVLTDSDESFL